MSAKNFPRRSPYDLSTGKWVEELKSGKAPAPGGGSNPYTGATNPAPRPEPKAGNKRK